MWKYAPVVLLIILAGCRTQPGATRARPTSSQNPTTTVADPATGSAQKSEIPWLSSLDEGLKQAQATHRPVMIDFFATWCGPCKMMDEEVWPDKAVAAAAGKFVTVRLDVDQHETEARQYNIDSIPAVVFLDAAGKEVDRSVGLVSVEDLLALMKKHSE